jgi:hypothetical protein
VSTEDRQDLVTSRARQMDLAAGLVAGYGRIVAEFFDAGQSRTLPWARRPQAAALVAAMADPDRGFGAIVAGEYDRAFYGGQYTQVAPLFEHYGVQLWTPEAGGPVDFQAPGHELLMVAMGMASKREITRTRIRVRTAMAAQTREQGRYLGGRPPYGYRLADAGPHPNKAHAGWGRRAHRLEPDPQTGPVVRWIFAQRLEGRGVARIARALNEAEIPCPSAADTARNPHRSGRAWTTATVAAILANPRPPGLEPPARQPGPDRPRQHGPGPPRRPALEPSRGWIISRRPAHPALVSEADWITVQQISAPRGPAGPATRRYLLAGLIRCGTWGAAWNPPGPTASPPTAAATATPAPPARTPPGRRTPTSARTRSCPTCPPWASSWPTGTRSRGSENQAPSGPRRLPRRRT